MNSTKTNQKISQKKNIITLIRRGISIPKISKRLNVVKSTVYYHYKKINKRKFPLAKIPKNDKVIGEFLGAFAGDGGFFFDKKTWHYTVSFHLHPIDDKDYGFYLKGLIEKNFNKKVRVYFKPKRELLLVFYSKKIFEFIDEYLNIKGNKTLNISLKKPLSRLSGDFLKYFVRGLVDTDGSVNKHRQIVVSLISKNMIYQTSRILEKFGIKNKVYLREKQFPWHKQYELKILNKDSLRYLKIIGFSNKRKEKICASRDLNFRS